MKQKDIKTITNAVSFISPMVALLISDQIKEDHLKPAPKGKEIAIHHQKFYKSSATERLIVPISVRSNLESINHPDNAYFPTTYVSTARVAQRVAQLTAFTSPDLALVHPFILDGMLREKES